jgi:hypothetical protein
MMIRIKRALLMTTVSLICAITLCMQGNYAQAQDLGEITPDMSFEFALVIAGQSAGSISSTAATPVDLTNVGIVSIGNQRLTASLEMTSQQIGAWWIALFGIGPQMGVDFSFGVAPLLGRPAQIAVASPVGFALATGGVFSLDPVSEEEPITYNINLSGG